MCSDSSNLSKVRQDTEDEQVILAMNAWHLARYVIEHDHEIALPDGVDMGQFMLWSEHYPSLKPDEMIQFVNQYALLEKVTGHVTARTLVATRIHGRGFFHAAFCTSVGKHLLFLSLIALMFVVLLLANTLWPEYFNMDQVLTPFFAAGLGSCVFLLRTTQEKLQNRQFDPARIPSHLIRLGLGMLAGGSIVFFPELLLTGEGAVPSDATVVIATASKEVAAAASAIAQASTTLLDNPAALTSIPDLMAEAKETVEELGRAVSDASCVVDESAVGRSALAFLFGYAVDMFYAVLDRVGGKQIKGD